MYPSGGVDVKKCWIFLVALFLTGCAAEETFETVADEQLVPVYAQAREIFVELPEEAAAPASSETRRALIELQEAPVGQLVALPGGEQRRRVQHHQHQQAVVQAQQPLKNPGI